MISTYTVVLFDSWAWFLCVIYSPMNYSHTKDAFFLFVRPVPNTSYVLSNYTVRLSRSILMNNNIRSRYRVLQTVDNSQWTKNKNYDASHFLAAEEKLFRIEWKPIVCSRILWTLSNEMSMNKKIRTMHSVSLCRINIQ